MDPRFKLLRAAHFMPQGNPKGLADLFSSAVSTIEIEVHSHCNRSCWFCGNSIIDRRSTRRYMPEFVYLALLDDLAGIEYCKRVSYSRYNEPFSDPVFYACVAQARTRLPKATLHANTNGDYLDETTLKKAYDAGLRSLNIQLYLSDDQPLSMETVGPMAEGALKRLPSLKLGVPVVEGSRISYRGGYRDMPVNMYARDFRRDGENRCTLPVRPQVHRTSPCLLTVSNVCVDYSGHVMPCCNLRSDFPKHEETSLGCLEAKAGSIFAIYGGEKAARWRRGLIGFQTKGGVCKDCSFDVIAPTQANRRAAQKWANS